MSKTSVSEAIAKEAQYGTLPVLTKERQFGFWDTLLLLGGYGIATWSYTQGAFQATMVNFPGLIATAIAPNILILAIYLLPVVFATRYGIDMWQWLKAIFGNRGIRIMVIIIIAINFPWFGVNATIFASTMVNLFATFGVPTAPWMSPFFGIICILLGTALALGGPPVIKWVNRFLVPALLGVGIVVVILAFTAAPLEQMLAYQPDISAFPNDIEPYVASVEAAFAFGFSWCCSTAVFPRLVRKERQGYWATIGAYGVITPFFIAAGGILAIAAFVALGMTDNDLAAMIMGLASPAVAVIALVLIVGANIGTQGTGSYMWSVVIKSAFPNAKYPVVVGILAAYASLIVLWGQIIDYFGAMISLAAYVYGPIMGLLFADYFFVRGRKLDLRSAYELPGHDNYSYSNGYNWVGFACLIAGFLASVSVFDAINYSARSVIFYFTTSSFLGFLVSRILYLALTQLVPTIRSYVLRDRHDITI